MAKTSWRFIFFGFLCIAALKIASASDIPSRHAQEVISNPITVTYPRNVSYLEIDFTDQETSTKTEAVLKALLEPNAPSDIVHEVKVSGSPTVGNWTAVSEVFQKLTALNNVHWEGAEPIPRTILTSLEVLNPSCRLHYTPNLLFWEYFDEDITLDQPISIEPAHSRRTYEKEAILGSKSLYALKADIDYGGRPNLKDMDLVFRILATCPNLRVLDLSLDHSGCVFSGGNPYAFDFLSHPEVRFPPLESLKLRGYDFGESSDGGKDWQYKETGYWKERIRWPWTTLPDSLVDWFGQRSIEYTWRGVEPWVYWPVRKQGDGRTGLDCWLQIMDWTSLHTLNLGWPDRESLHKLGGHPLPSLRNLTLVGAERNASLDFLSDVQPLETIALQHMGFEDLERVVDVLSNSQSKELRNLELHQSEAEWSGYATSIVSMNGTELFTLVNAHPDLEHLTLDMPRVDPWNWTLYSTISSSPSLKFLTLHYPSPDMHGGGSMSNMNMFVRGIQPEDDVVDPIVNASSVQALFEHLGREKNGAGLEWLEVLVGKWEQRFEQGGMMGREMKRVARYFCGGSGKCEGGQMRNVEW